MLESRFLNTCAILLTESTGLLPVKQMGLNICFINLAELGSENDLRTILQKCDILLTGKLANWKN